MKENAKFDVYDSKIAIKYAKQFAGKQYTDEMGTVLTVALKDLRNLPVLGYGKVDLIPFQDYISKWVDKYLKGFNGRPSVRTGKKSNTYSDPIVKLVLQARLPKITKETADQVEGGHSLMMTIENLVGDLLEEYLSIKLKENGWCCCWGSTMDAVDFCKADGSLIQIKNSDNSENSSSSRVRAGTTIEKWYRRKSTKEGAFFWDGLNAMVKRKDLTEDDFRKFVQNTIKKNPGCLYVPPDHSLNKK
jgi:hypothetical protein